jgi:hypothetical protein
MDVQASLFRDARENSTEQTRLLLKLSYATALGNRPVPNMQTDRSPYAVSTGERYAVACSARRK